MYDQCGACKAEIVPEDIVVWCKGLCESQQCYHARCVGLSYDEGCACLHRNIFWMCDSCRDAIERDRFRKSFDEKQENAYAKKSDLDDLKSEMSRINEMVSQMVNNSAAVSNQSTSSGCHHANRFTEKHSTPLSSTKVSSDLSSHALNDVSLQLYVTNIGPDVAQREVEQMVCESIGAEFVLELKCLVPLWRNISTLDYVSYKVTVDAQFREAALRSSNWPNGVRCREFRNFSDTAWRPSMRTTEIAT